MMMPQIGWQLPGLLSENKKMKEMCQTPQYKSLSCWRVNKHDDPMFLLHFFNVHIMNVDYAKFQKKFGGKAISRESP